MVNNTTSILNQTTKSMNEQTDTNDLLGAIIFIIVVLLWYSSSVIVLLGMQIGRRSEVIEDPTKFFVQGLRKQSNNKEILSKKNLKLYVNLKEFDLFRRTC